MNSAIIIPARYKSKRMHGKLMAKIAGIPLIEHVYNVAYQSAEASQVILITDSLIIYDYMKITGAHVILSKEEHRCGTDRCYEAIKDESTLDVLVNWQGDQWLRDCTIVDEMIRSMKANPEWKITSLMSDLNEAEMDNNPDTVKVICDQNSFATDFKRKILSARPTSFHHVGIYGFRKEVLRNIVILPSSKRELEEGLEQLRWMEHGYRIKMIYSDHKGISINNAEDVKRAIHIIRHFRPHLPDL